MTSVPWQELAKFQELIFEDFANFILVENTYEEVVLQSVMKDIMQGRGLWGQGAWTCSARSPRGLQHSGVGVEESVYARPGLSSS